MKTQAAPQQTVETAEPPGASSGKPVTSPRRLLADRSARWLVTAGGMAIIASILGILLFIVLEVVPLVLPARVSPGAELSVSPAALALAGDEHRTHLAMLGRDGVVRALRTADGRVVMESSVLPEGAELDRAATAPGHPVLTATTTDGRVVVVPVKWEVDFEDNVRIVRPVRPEPAVLEMDPQGRPLGAYSAQADEEGGALAAAQLEDGSIAIVRRVVEEQFLTGELSESFQRIEGRSPFRLSRLAVDGAGDNLYGGTDAGQVLWWRIEGERLAEPEVLPAGDAAVTALSLLIGDRSLVVGQADGSLSIWFPVRQEDQSFRFVRIRQFDPYPGAIRAIAPSMRNKCFLAVDETGRTGLHHSTSERLLWAGQSPLSPVDAIFYSPKADGGYLSSGARLASLEIDNPHPEMSWKALFGRVWYEGYPEPEYVWQSSSATDDFEPKLSLVPLLVGTLKGTIYSLFLAIPLGVFGAMYASQFMHPRYKRIVKPTVEIMAALPSVVLGFLAGLWLAPRLERYFPALLLMGILLPALVLAAGYLWRLLPAGVRGRFPPGSETFVYVVVLAAGIWVSLAASAWLEGLAFGGDFQAWLLEATGLAYDQRNAVVVGLAMGFAVIPIIFAIAEDAFSNVPAALTSGSLALGASRWQTVTQVVLPTASPGIFSAVMVGFGRAVGETMIVLMATGNTPILDWSPFNGFRTLSANIAVEIPEAPVGGTLYRTLFLAALLLFALTFAVNTAAEIVRQHLRRRYAEL